MNLVYKTVESTVKPASIEIQKTTVYLRKDFVKEVRNDGFGNETDRWLYQEAALSHEEFNTYSSQIAAMNAIKGENDSENIYQIIENSFDSSNNQLILMEAIADLYDFVARLIEGGTKE